MTAKKKGAKNEGKKFVAEPKFATADELQEVTKQVASIDEGLATVIQMMKEDRDARASSAATPGDGGVSKDAPTPKEARVGGPNRNLIDPEWEERAREIIGDAVDHCEMEFGAKGGVRFTVVIKTEMSNAPHDYLKMMGSDRRTKDIAGEGIAGVEEWCKLIKQNLGQPRRV